MEDLGGVLDGGRQHARAATEDHPPVGRDVPVVQEVLGVEERAALGRDLGREVLGQRLGGDDVARDRDDPPAQARDDAVGVGVGGDEDVAGEDRAALGLDDEATVAPGAGSSARGRPRGGRRRPGRRRRRARRSSGPGGRARCPARPARRSRRRCRSPRAGVRAGRRSIRRPSRRGSRARARDRARATAHRRARGGRARGSRSRSIPRR